MTRILSGTALSLAAVSPIACTPKGEQAIPSDKAVEAKVEQVLGSLSLKEKAGQLVQLNISVLEDATREAIDPAKLDYVIGEQKVGSILNVMHDRAHSREETAAMVRQIQDKSMEAIGVPCIYGLDMIHGASYLVEGSLFPQEINLGASSTPGR